jgi:predicted regulator of Ras-like GTPase activity (Roadblock/LC7/MglB family)
MPDSIAQWTQELARNPRSLAFLRLAEALRRRRQPDEALAVTLRGLERHPYLPDAHDMLARLCADAGDDLRARDEWETALRLEPRHAASMKGLGFLSYRAGDLGTAEHLLRAALDADPGDEGARVALDRVVQVAQSPATANGRREPAPVPEATPDATSPAAQGARELFASLLGDGDRTALLLDDDGLVLAGAYVDGAGRDAADEIGAELSGISDEATRALDNLGLGRWESILVEARFATVALAPACGGATVLVAAARDTSVGLVRRLLAHARDRATGWLGALR